MKLLFKSTYLFLFGLYIEYYKYRFETLITKHIKNCENLSCQRLVEKSNKCCNLYLKFREYEQVLLNEINLKRLESRPV